MALPQPKITYRSTSQTDPVQAVNQPYFNGSVTTINNSSYTPAKPNLVTGTPTSKTQTAASYQPAYAPASKIANTTDFNKQNQIRNVSIIRNRSNPRSRADSINTAQIRNQTPYPSSVKSLIKNNPAAILAQKTKVTSVSLGILAWSINLWLFVQLPFAVLGLIMLGLMGAMDSIASLFAKENQVSGDIGSWLFYKATAVAGWVAEKAIAGVEFVTGIDINIGSMADGLFFFFYLTVFMVGFLTLLSASIIYTMANQRPLSGDGSGIKIGMFLLAIIGYMAPVFNLFPWYLLWMATVWKYPR